MPFVLMVAGPNGSGKTTLTQHLRQSGIELGHYINADDIAAGLSGSYGARVRAAQDIADAERQKRLQEFQSFTFETVMSHPSKVEFFKTCAKSGFDTVLYFVATANPRLNVARVAQRVALGGHDVPADRIRDRYHRTLGLLPEALKIASSAAVFDNSGPDGLKLCLKKTGSGYQPAPDAPDWVIKAFHAAMGIR